MIYFSNQRKFISAVHWKTVSLWSNLCLVLRMGLILINSCNINLFYQLISLKIPHCNSIMTAYNPTGTDFEGLSQNQQRKINIYYTPQRPFGWCYICLAWCRLTLLTFSSHTSDDNNGQRLCHDMQWWQGSRRYHSVLCVNSYSGPIVLVAPQLQSSNT